MICSADGWQYPPDGAETRSRKQSYRLRRPRLPADPFRPPHSAGAAPSTHPPAGPGAATRRSITRGSDPGRETDRNRASSRPSCGQVPVSSASHGGSDAPSPLHAVKEVFLLRLELFSRQDPLVPKARELPNLLGNAYRRWFGGTDALRRNSSILVKTKVQASRNFSACFLLLSDTQFGAFEGSRFRSVDQ